MVAAVIEPAVLQRGVLRGLAHALGPLVMGGAAGAPISRPSLPFLAKIAPPESCH